MSKNSGKNRNRWQPNTSSRVNIQIKEATTILDAHLLSLHQDLDKAIARDDFDLANTHLADIDAATEVVQRLELGQDTDPKSTKSCLVAAHSLANGQAQHHAVNSRNLTAVRNRKAALAEQEKVRFWLVILRYILNAKRLVSIAVLCAFAFVVYSII